MAKNRPKMENNQKGSNKYKKITKKSQKIKNKNIFGQKNVPKQPKKIKNYQKGLKKSEFFFKNKTSLLSLLSLIIFVAFVVVFQFTEVEICAFEHVTVAIAIAIIAKVLFL